MIARPDSGMPLDPQALRARATTIIERLKQQDSGRPLFVEFSGTPKSGKSSCIDIVGHFFRRLGYRVLAPTEGASKRTPYYLKEDLVAFNVWSACYALTHILEGRYHADRYHIAILDRGLFDALAWFDLLATKGDIPPEIKETIQSFLLIPNWRSLTDVVFLFRADPATSLARETANKLIQDPGRAMNPTFLADLNNAYDRVHEQFRSEFPRFETIDTSASQASTPESTAATVAAVILDLLDARLGSA